MPLANPFQLIPFHSIITITMGCCQSKDSEDRKSNPNPQTNPQAKRKLNLTEKQLKEET